MTGSDPTENERRRRRTALALFALIQAAAATFFLSDAIRDLTVSVVDSHTIIESVIAVGLVLGAAFGVWEMVHVHRDLVRHQRALAVARGALGEVIDTQFERWGLTQAERDVGYLALKGFDNAEIARLRNSAAGTVRAQMTHVYAKAGVSGRAQFAAYFVEDLLESGIPGEAVEASLRAKAAE